MRSGELADLADVSVRTLRHYHQIGLLAEPPRSSNGYRDYDVHDLVRLLRIRRLVDVGVRLEDIGSMLEGSAKHGTQAALAELDAAIAAQIEHLQARRRLLAAISIGDDAADLPAGLGSHLARLADRGFDQETLRLERDQAVLVHHLLGREVSAMLATETWTLLGDPDARVSYVELTSIGEDAHEGEREALADRLAGFLLPVVERLRTALPDTGTGRGAALPGLIDDLLTTTQRDVIARVERRLGE